MSFAWEITQADIMAILQANNIADKDNATSEKILYEIDVARVQKAALRGDDINEQTQYANEEITDILQEMEIIPIPSKKVTKGRNTTAVTKSTLALFSNGKNGMYPWDKIPFNMEDKTVSTDGSIILFIPKQDGFLECDHDDFNRIKKIKNTLPQHMEKNDFESGPLPTKKTCPVCGGTKSCRIKKCCECRGHGKVHFKNEFHSYYVECLNCFGKGEFIEPGKGDVCDKCKGLGLVFEEGFSIPFMGGNIQTKYLYLLLTSFNNIHFHYNPKVMMYVFKGDNVEGFVMGLNMHPS